MAWWEGGRRRRRLGRGREMMRGYKWMARENGGGGGAAGAVTVRCTTAHRWFWEWAMGRGSATRQAKAAGPDWGLFTAGRSYCTPAWGGVPCCRSCCNGNTSATFQTGEWLPMLDDSEMPKTSVWSLTRTAPTPLGRLLLGSRRSTNGIDVDVLCIRLGDCIWREREASEVGLIISKAI